jgi:NTE family protein
MSEKTTQRRLGLALGGGGARGLAHIGVIKVFESAGIPVAYLAGSSMGGLIGALYAAGWSGEELEQEVLSRTRFRQMVKLVDLGPSRRGFLVGQRVREQLGDLIGNELSFAQLRIPLALTAVDLCTGKELTLCTGSVLEAVLATTAVPGLMPPVVMNGCQLIDGGVLNNVPTDVARAGGADVIAAVDVNPPFPSNPLQSPEENEKTWPAIFPQFAQDFYTAELIMVNALTRMRIAQSPPDLLIQPPIPDGISIFWGFTRAREAIAAGEASARQALPAIEKLIAYSGVGVG